MSKNKPDKEYYLLFLLIFILAFAFGVVVGCYVCTTGDSGDLTVQVVDGDGDAAPSGATVKLAGAPGAPTEDTDSNGEAVFQDLGATNGITVKVNGSETNVTSYNYDGTDTTITVKHDEDNYGPSKLVG